MNFLAIFILFVVVPKVRDSKTTEVPDVYGMNITSAEKSLFITSSLLMIPHG